MSRFLNAGKAYRSDDGQTLRISTGITTYEVAVTSIQRVLAYGSHEDLFRRVSQASLDGYSDLKGWGSISMSETRISVKVRPNGGRLYLINADALRDVMRGKTPFAAVSEVVFSQPKKRIAIFSS